MSKQWGNIKTLGQVVPLEELAPPVHKPEEFYGKNVLLVDFQRKQGEFVRDDGTKGEYVLMTIKTDPDGEDILISCGGWQIMLVVEALETGEVKLPLVCRFMPSGRSVFLTEPTD